MPFKLILKIITLDQKCSLSRVYQILMLEVVINDKDRLEWGKDLRANIIFSVENDNFSGSYSI